VIVTVIPLNRLMQYPADNKLVMRPRRATGLPVLDARRVIEGIAPSQQLDYVIATENRPVEDGNAYDPIEDDSISGPIIRQVRDAVSHRVRMEHDENIAEMRLRLPAVADTLACGRGLCHKIWRETKRELMEIHAID